MRLNETTFFARHALFSRPHWPLVTVTENRQTRRRFRENYGVRPANHSQTISQLLGPFICYRHQANAADAYCHPARPNLAMQVSNASIFLFLIHSLFPYLISYIRYLSAESKLDYACKGRLLQSSLSRTPR